MTWTIGVDVGGTFTGFYALDEAIGAVCLLFAFRNPAHENRIAARCCALPFPASRSAPRSRSSPSSASTSASPPP